MVGLDAVCAEPGGAEVVRHGDWDGTAVEATTLLSCRQTHR
ncbi:hypothetical protein ACQEVG_33565 [Streptomyces sp. CA-135486]